MFEGVLFRYMSIYPDFNNISEKLSYVFILHMYPAKLRLTRALYELQNFGLFSICYLAKEPVYSHLHLQLGVSSHSSSMPHQRVHLHCNSFVSKT
jgi:hypothetical protein